MAHQVIRNTIVYFSPTGTTRTVAKSIAQGLAINPREFDLTLSTERTKTLLLDEAEFVLFAFPVYGGRLPGLVREFLVQLPKGRRPVAAVVVYGNVGYGDALLELYDLCVNRDYEVKAAAAFVGEHSYSHVLGRDRPNSADKESARVFGVGIRQTLFGNWAVAREALARGPKSQLRNYGIPPSVNFALRPHACEACRLCVRNCPVGAFQNGDPKIIDPGKCIACAACVKLCPHNARTFADDDFLDEVAMMVASNAEAKRPATFLPPNLPEYMG
ncbi:MAG: 4Fe-4S binding protein [Deltaproteobacteria bacterium]|jgi:ferredoxin|nr:4Fe-4S binding protein [Deltaproteobacteria bacterium]